MNFDINTIPNFDKNAKKLSKRYKSLKNDIINLVSELRNNPYIGADLGSGVRKIRMAISDKGKGKSHGARVITYTVEVDEASGTVTLLAIYDKKDQESITQKEISELLEENEELRLRR